MFKLAGVNPNEIIAKINKKKEEFAKKERKLTHERHNFLKLLPFKKRDSNQEQQTGNSEDQPVQSVDGVVRSKFYKHKSFF